LSELEFVQANVFVPSVLFVIETPDFGFATRVMMCQVLEEGPEPALAIAFQLTAVAEQADSVLDRFNENLLCRLCEEMLSAFVEFLDGAGAFAGIDCGGPVYPLVRGRTQTAGGPGGRERHRGRRS
jgi:hypothetical protein